MWIHYGREIPSSPVFQAWVVYVTGFTDDRSCYRVVSRAYLRKRKEEAIDALHNALKKGRVSKRGLSRQCKAVHSKGVQSGAGKVSYQANLW